MGGKHRVAQPCTHSQPSQPRRLLCKELFTPGLGRCFISTVRYSAHIAPHCQNLGAGSLCVVGDQPGEVWLCPLQSRVLAGGAGLGLSPTTSQARQSKKRHFPTNLPCLYGSSCWPGWDGGSAPWAGAQSRFPLPAQAGRAALATSPWGVATPSRSGRKLVPCGLFTSRAGISVGSHGDVGISVGTAANTRLDTDSRLGPRHGLGSGSGGDFTSRTSSHQSRGSPRRERARPGRF